MAATLLFSLAAIAGTIIAFAAMLNLMPLDRYFGVRLSLPAGALVQMFLIVAPMCLLASAIQIIIATYTRSFKEAQNYLGFLPMVPGLPGLLLSFMPVKAELWTMLIPTFGQQLLINQVLRGGGREQRQHPRLGGGHPGRGSGAGLRGHEALRPGAAAVHPVMPGAVPGAGSGGPQPAATGGWWRGGRGAAPMV
ncbi:MAG TPA: hypothetical protein VFD42_06775 [Chloroflexota bacterium]|nr:hypothetical protein [Chloroflexota bacterium]